MNWSNWQSFPDPRKGEYLNAPFGLGVYQLRNRETKELILFGSGKNLAYRMASLLPPPLGQGTRKCSDKREYVLKNIEKLEYRTIPFLLEAEMKSFEQELKSKKNHLFNT